MRSSCVPAFGQRTAPRCVSNHKQPKRHALHPGQTKSMAPQGPRPLQEDLEGAEGGHRQKGEEAGPCRLRVSVAERCSSHDQEPHPGCPFALDLQNQQKTLEAVDKAVTCLSVPAVCRGQRL